MAKKGVITIIKPKGFINALQMDRLISNILTQTAEACRADFAVTTQTWKKRPDFEIKKYNSKGDRIAEIFTTNLIYHFVSGGTRVRYAVMTPDFRAKTIPDQIRSRKGRGGVAFISRLRPRPGIKARNFDKRIAEKWQKQLPVQIQRAIETELAAMVGKP